MNRAVHLFGSSLEQEIQRETNKLKKNTEIQNKSRQIMMKWLSLPGEQIKGQFRDPAVG